MLLLFPGGDVLGLSQSSQEDYMSYRLGAYAFKERDLASSGVPHLLPWEVSWEKEDVFSEGLALTARLE